MSLVKAKIFMDFACTLSNEKRFRNKKYDSWQIRQRQVFSSVFN